jgi:hypothetical protein
MPCGTDARKIDPIRLLRQSVRRGRAMTWPNFRRLCARQDVPADPRLWRRTTRRKLRSLA